MKSSISIGSNIYLLREDAIIKKSIVESVAANPVSAALADDDRYKCIVKNLEGIAR